MPPERSICQKIIRLRNEWYVYARELRAHNRQPVDWYEYLTLHWDEVSTGNEM